MKSIRTKILCLVLSVTILASFVVGMLSIQNAQKQIQQDSAEIIARACTNSAQKIDAVISRIEQSVQTLAGCALGSLSDTAKFQSDAAYVENYTQSLKTTLLTAAENTEGAITAYLRFNPDFTEPTSGLFFSRDSADSPFSELEPTDFSIYDKTDLARVGWYYIPVQNGKATWMAPYLNENLQVYMISYVVPLFKDGVSIGIVGMDIDFRLLEGIVDGTKIYETGSAFLADKQGDIMYHKDLAVNDDIAGLGTGVQALTTALQTEKTSDGDNTLIQYQYGGVDKKMAYRTLKNGMQFVLTAPLSEINASANQLIRQIVGSTVTAVLVSLFISLFIVRGVVRPITELNRTAQKIADGDLDVTVTCTTKDEVGALASSIGLTVTRLKEYVNYIREISDVLEEIARGNLVFKLHYDYAGEFSMVKESMMNISHSLNHTLLDIRYASEQVTNGSQQVSSGAQALSDGAAKQAASVTQLSSTIHEFSEQVSQNAKNAQEVCGLTVDTVNGIEESNRYMQEMTVSMQSITEASNKISQIVKTVEDIASQTNILALNAAVEAARAGEAGKGFAVVAGEVRSLAAKVGAATKNISDLVQNAIVAIHGGTSIVGKTGDSLKAVVEKSQIIESKIQQISAASEWQSNSIGQVNDEIGQISAVVQQNSATAQQGAAASEEMSGQAETLRELIGHFKLESVEKV